MTPIIKAGSAALDDLVEGERAAVFTISTDAVDRDNEVVLPSGLDTRNYQKNPIVLAIHDSHSWPVGKALWTKSANGGRELRSKVRFASNPAGDEAWELVKAGIVGGASIGFLPDMKVAGPPTGAELKLRPEWKGASRVFRKAELLEWSLVPVPCNPEALVLAVSKGLTLPKWMAPPEVVLPPLGGRSFEQALAAKLAEARAVDISGMVAHALRESLAVLRGRA